MATKNQRHARERDRVQGTYVEEEARGHLTNAERASTTSEPRDRSAPTPRRARARVGESEGRSPSDKARSHLTNAERVPRASHAIGARLRSGARERVSGVRGAKPLG